MSSSEASCLDNKGLAATPSILLFALHRSLLDLFDRILRFDLQSTLLDFLREDQRVLPPLGRHLRRVLHRLQCTQDNAKHKTKHLNQIFEKPKLNFNAHRINILRPFNERFCVWK